MRRVSRTSRRVVPKKRMTGGGAKAVTSGKATGAEQSRKVNMNFPIGKIGKISPLQGMCQHSVK